MKRLKAFRYRIYPDAEQEDLFRRTAGCCRFVYNLCLEQRGMGRGFRRRRLSAIDQIKELPALKAEALWLKEVPNHPLQQAVLDLDRAFRNFFERRAAWPQFRKRGDRDSFRFPDPRQFRVVADRIFLPKAGWVEMALHRPYEGAIRTATVTREADCWFVSLQCAMDVEEPARSDAAPVGLDMGVVKPITLSSGDVIMLPRVSDAERRKLATLQQRVARRTKGSRNRRKAKMGVARFHAKLARRRKDAAHKATTTLVQNHGLIIVEDLRVANMTASARGTVEQPGVNVAAKSGLNRSILDVAPSQIRSMLAYKAAWRGSRLVAVPAAYTSQRCSGCGHTHKDNRVTRARFACVQCGHADDADVNAAKNILQLGLKRNAPTGGRPGMACESNRISGRKQELLAVRP